MLKEENGYVRSIDIANKLNYSKASVSIAMKNLKENGFISITPSNNIELTDAGIEIARNMFERHTTITKFLIKIGVDEKNAEIDACKIEHVISKETFEKIKKYTCE